MPVDYDERYRKGWAYGKLPSSVLTEVVQNHLKPGVSLDTVSLGEGQGRNAVYLATLGHRCLALDTSSVGLAKAHQLATEHGVADRVDVHQTSVMTFDVSCR